MNSTRHIKDRMLGCLFGQAVGDALGLGSEFLSKEEVNRYYPDGLKRYDQIIQDAHRRRWPKGAWTDDTDMMLCILNGFENGRFNISHVAANFKEWFNGEPMGIGSLTYKVLCMADYVEQPEMCAKLWWEASRRQSAANGALMRTSLVGLAPNNVTSQAEAVCKLTHYDPRCVGSCVIAVSIIPKDMTTEFLNGWMQRITVPIFPCSIWMKPIPSATLSGHCRQRCGVTGILRHLKTDYCQ